jgi:aminoglycoside/choline kinase family phosphotransferase
MSGVLTPEAMDAAWLTERLREGGHAEAQVAAVTRTQIGTGQIGKCVRFDLTLAAGDESTPCSLVGKFASDDPVSRATGVQLRNYYLEVNFYQHLAEKLSISVPRCYYADIIDEGPEFALLLEDMRPAEQGDQLSGCSAEVAEAAVLELVGLQAPFWCDEALREFDWLARSDEQAAAVSIIDLYAQLLPAFMDRFGDSLAADERDIISNVARSPGCPLFQPVQPPFCLEHVDYRLDNMLIDTRTSPLRVTVVDWQSVRIGKPMNDVAYFLGAGLLPAVRREVEQDIVRAYHRRLSDADISAYPWDICWNDYRRGAFSGFGVTVIAATLVQQTERGDEMFTAMARRHSRHALDLGADEFLD